jgi:hypothetical protein
MFARRSNDDNFNRLSSETFRNTVMISLIIRCDRALIFFGLFNVKMPSDPLVVYSTSSNAVLMLVCDF